MNWDYIDFNFIILAILALFGNGGFIWTLIKFKKEKSLAIAKVYLNLAESAEKAVSTQSIVIDNITKKLEEAEKVTAKATELVLKYEESLKQKDKYIDECLLLFEKHNIKPPKAK